jgi:hypothetical protein
MCKNPLVFALFKLRRGARESLKISVSVMKIEQNTRYAGSLGPGDGLPQCLARRYACFARRFSIVGRLFRPQKSSQLLDRLVAKVPPSLRSREESVVRSTPEK